MYLTEKRDRTPGQERDAKDHAEVEILLESVQKQVEEIVSEVETTIVRFVCFSSSICASTC